MGRLIWGFAGRTYHIVGNLMSRLIYLILNKWSWQVISLFCVQTWKFIYIIIHSGWNYAWIFMKERANLCNAELGFLFRKKCRYRWHLKKPYVQDMHWFLCSLKIMGQLNLRIKWMCPTADKIICYLLYSMFVYILWMIRVPSIMENPFRKFSKILNTSCLPKRPWQTLQTLIRLLLKSAQTASSEAVWSWSLLFAILTSILLISAWKNHHFNREQKEKVFKIKNIYST